MSKKLLIFLILILVVFSHVYSDSGQLDFALFKRTVSPVMKWGENGVLTVPKATTVGRTNAYLGVFGQQAGKFNNLDLYLTSATLMIGTSEDVEIGYTRRQLIWEDFYFTDLAMDTFHLKARVLDFGASLLPSVAVGVNGVSLVDNTFTNEKDILFNPYVVATSKIALIPNFLEFSVTALAETIMSDGEFGTLQFSAGADANLLNMLYVFGEVQGIDIEVAQREMVNIGAKVKLGWLSAGVGLFNIIRDEQDATLSDNPMKNITESTFNLDAAQYMASVVIEVPLGKLLLGNK